MAKPPQPSAPGLLARARAYLLSLGRARSSAVLLAAFSLAGTAACGDDPMNNETSTAAADLRKALGGTNGDVDYCAGPAGECVAGEGDCDNHADCQGALVCGADNGAKFGFPAVTDVCVPAHCSNRTRDDGLGETAVDCGGPCGSTCPSPSGSAGTDGYCSPRAPCAQGGGDCDRDIDCAVGLVCAQNNGDNFGFSPLVDVCVPSHCANGVLDSGNGETGIDCGGDCGSCPGHVGSAGGEDYCSPTTTCAAGEGDCDANSECDTGLTCGRDNGAKYGFAATTDVCVPAHCANRVRDVAQGETGVDCGGPCGTCASPSGTPGSGDYCSWRTPCPQGGGDCDRDIDCLSDLVCGQDNGDKFGFNALQDVCVPAHCTNGTLDAGSGETGVDCGGDCGACPGHVGSAGDEDYCSSATTCAAGEGDCDANTECDSGLVCGRDNGAKHGFSATTDVCVASHCTNRVRDEAQGETGIDCGGPCGTCASPSGTPGSGNYCSWRTPCSQGGGDCDSDIECLSGLVCAQDNGSKFGFSELQDVCVPAHCTNGTLDSGSGETAVDCGGDCGTCPGHVGNAGDDGYCSRSTPCSEGEGDCDSNAECDPGLYCGRGNGAAFGFSSATDVCVIAQCINGARDEAQGETAIDCGGSCGSTCPTPTGTLGSDRYCNGRAPCAQGQGDCDNNLQCAVGLVCGADNGAKFGFSQLIDVCVPSHCTNGALDSGTGETSVDCGGACGTTCPVSQGNVDECALGTDNCSDHATCDDDESGFLCTCNPGYAGNGVTCTDIDECSSGTHSCDTNATCTNTAGSHTCSCKTGYTGNGQSCSPLFDIVLHYVNPPTAEQRAVFEAAEARWEDLIVADISDFPVSPATQSGCLMPSGTTFIDDVIIEVNLSPIDGVGNVLGSAGPRCVRGGTLLPLNGVMTFDTADLASLAANGTLEAVILHEMGHVLGVGPLWSSFVSNPSCTGGPTASGSDARYTGSHAVTAWRSLGGTGDVPVENSRGSGSCDAHWREFGSGLGEELMSPILSSVNALSVITLRSLVDLGYTVAPDSRADSFSPTLLMAPGHDHDHDHEPRPTVEMKDDIDDGPIFEVTPEGDIGRRLR